MTCFVAPLQEVVVTGVPITCWDAPGAPGAKVVQGTTVQDTRTTLMLRNLPNDYTRDMVIGLLNKMGLSGHFDFFYLPTDFNSNAGLGYAFVNGVTHEDALTLWKVLQGFSDWEMPSQKVLEVSWSEISQGLDAHIERYRDSSVMHPDVPQEFKPVVFQQGVPQMFPAATKQIRAPRLKKPNQNQRKSVDSTITEAVAKPASLSPWERIQKTIALVNSGDIAKICAHARSTLSSTLEFLVPALGDVLRNISDVCKFHKLLHEAIPDLQLSLDNIRQGDGDSKQVTWRVTCSGTQIKPFLALLPVGSHVKFSLEVVVKEGTNGKPKTVSWNFAREQSRRWADIEFDEVDAETDVKKLMHLRGECQPCAYFAFRADGCRNDDCEFCHFCTKTQARAKKKARALKAAKEAKFVGDVELSGVNHDGEAADAASARM
jgi:hypothetical protein